MDIPAEKLHRLFEEKKRVLQLKGNYTHKQLEDAFHQRQTGTYLKDFIFGANDGIVTTFAVVAGATGANLSSFVVIILGFANLLGDGLSMGLGNYLGDKSDAAYDKGQRQKEYWEIKNFPEIEKHEIAGIFRRWGFEGKQLDDAVETLSRNPDTWVNFMMREELGIVEEGEAGSPAKHGLAIFTAFVTAGMIPLLPYLIPVLHAQAFRLSVMLSGITFCLIGAFRAKLAPLRWWVAGIEVFIIGGLASGAAYLIGKLLERIAH